MTSSEAQAHGRGLMLGPGSWRIPSCRIRPTLLTSAVLATVLSLLLSLSLSHNAALADGSNDWLPDSNFLPRARIDERDYDKLSDAALRAIPRLSDPAPLLNHHLPSSLLSSILIPRPPDTENSTIVRERILSVFQKQLGKNDREGRSGWHIETPVFEASTPQGKRRMTNMIFTKDPSAPRKVVLAAHYDSKWFAPATGMAGFIGATDSAAPCAILVDTAVALDALLDEKERRIKEMVKTGKGKTRKRVDDTTLQIILLDGEEAYGQWTHVDSIYGARNLVSQWKTSFWKPSTLSSRDELGPRRFKSFTQPTRRIDTIEHFVLLDLLGTPNPQIPSYYKDTSWLHSELMDLEKRLRDSQAFTPDGRNHGSPFMSSKPSWGQIEDDHLPFLANGVPILHLIPNPFPKVWHLLSDDADALDYPTNYSWAMLMRAFVVEYLGLDVADAKAPRGLEKAHEELVSRANAIYLSAPSVDNFNNRFPASGSSNHQTRPTITVS